MTRTTTLFVAATTAAAALLTAGCQDRVYGDRSYHGNVYGDGTSYPSAVVYGDRTFHDADRVSGTPEFARRSPDTAQTASVRTETPSRPEPAPSRQAPDTPVDEVARSTNAPTTPDRREPAPTPPPAAAERPPVTEARPTPPRDERPAAEVARDTGLKNTPATPAGRDPEMVARADTARYPDDLKPSDDLRATAVFDRANKTLRIDNNSDHDVLGGNLWASETYVTPVPNIPAGGSVTVHTDQFYDRDGKRLPSFNDVLKLQLQSGGKLYNLKLEGGAELNK